MWFSKRNVIARDNGECQYCGIKAGKKLSIDHVIPISRKGTSDYSNCVACCNECNNRKSNRTPKEANMVLRRKPVKPSFFVFNKGLLTDTDTPEEWKIYIINYV